ncbi:MAG TPA: ABC transporter permease [Dehalococcoidia bacterium]|nr:ABC transporter permease [Dehalococcoidia bacterium]
MLAYTIRRVLWIVPVLWVIATITFFMMHAVPGGPFTRDKERPPALEAAVQREYGLDQPIYEQYARYIGDLVRGDLGISFHTRQPVMDTIIDRAFTSAQIALLTLVVAVVVGMVLGVLSALNHNGAGDYAGVFLATAGASVPHFIVAMFLVIVFSVNLGWFDQVGWGGPATPGDIFNFSAYEPKKMVMPVVALSALPAAYIARVTRASMLEVLNQDYIRTARAKGLRETRIVLRHTLKNAMIPVLTVVGPIAALLASGSFIIESMFNIGGIGREAILAAQRRDYGLIMGTALFYALIVSVANLVVDLLYAVVDPRIRYR